MKIDSVKLSEKAKNQLIVLKRKTGIENWNVLCRWAFMLSLRETSIPPHENIPTDSNVEMTWKVFSGEYSDLYTTMLIHRIYIDYNEIDESKLNYYFRLHLHRGISYLGNNTSNIDELVELAH
ncbi:DNA sulfur modification protein DndE [Shewanella acanthi]|uniref:DNA sulfur modification protein DndE n=1 Tax=Shewanella acanthi TaxID=2864212 RepID=UPI001C65F6CE|nr:DNA sulfur modification protein DndE [Shewanella acanthi]QYJ77919.1 DNA sulfur modification protein DndE [Shewanella acanthi]